MKPKNQARLAGLLYFLLTIQAPIALLYIPSHVLVQDNPAVTMDNLVSHEFMVRLSIVSQLLSTTIFLYLAFILYRLFKPVNQFQAGILVAFVLAQFITTFVFEVFTFTALKIAIGDILTSAPLAERQNLALLALKIHSWGISIQELLWGLWLLPFGMLVYRSGFMPKILAYTLIFGFLCWVTDSISFILLPDSHDAISAIIMKVSWIGEMPILFYMLIVGTKKEQIVADVKD